MGVDFDSKDPPPKWCFSGLNVTLMGFSLVQSPIGVSHSCYIYIITILCTLDSTLCMCGKLIVFYLVWTSSAMTDRQSGLLS